MVDAVIIVFRCKWAMAATFRPNRVPALLVFGKGLDEYQAAVAALVRNHVLFLCRFLLFAPFSIAPRRTKSETIELH